MKAIAIKDGEESAVASATYTIVTPLTSIKDIFETATSSSQNVYITFGNWIVSGIDKSSTSVRAYVTDGTNGFVIYNSAGHGFNKGDIISGTAQCSLSKPSAGYAQITNITPSDVTVNTGGAVAAANISLSSLSGINVGTLVSYNDLAYDGSVLSDGETSITPYGEIMSISGKFTNGKKYDVTGVYFQYYTYSTSTTTKEICPREDTDIVLKADLDIDASMTPFSYIIDNGPSAVENIDVTCTDLGTNILTATASSDYEVSLTLDGTYTQFVEMAPTSGKVMETIYVRLKAGLSAGEHNGTVTFTAANLTTQYVDLEGLVSGSQTYAIILDQPTGATISSDVAVAEAGQTITLSYFDVDDCYEFFIWSVLYEIGEDIFDITPDANNQFTMPAADVYVYATFEQKTFTVSYSVNGTVVSTESVNCGSNATLPSTGFTVPTGYTFAGWTTNPSYTTVVASYIPTDNATLYSVMTQSGSTLNYVKVTEDLTDWSGEYLIVYENDRVAFNGGLTTLDGGNNVIEVTITDGKIASNSKIDESNFTIASVSGGYSIKSASGYYIGSTTYNNELKTSTTQAYANTLSIDGGDAVILGYSSGSDKTTLRFNSSSGTTNYRFRYYKSGQQDIQLYKKQVPSAYTRVEEISSAETLPSIEPTYLITVQNGGVLTLTGANNGDASNLIIEDGGQLITNNDVTATLQKDITAATNWGQQDPDDPYTANGWYFIASPVNSFATSNIVAGTATTDLYSYDEATNYWFNAQSGSHTFTSLTNGQGYLYANSTGNDLSFTGEMPATNTNIVMNLSYANNGNLKGFNLMGNPFTCNLTSENVKILKGETMTGITSYYIVENGTEITQKTLSTNPIKPGRGFLIQADGEGQKLVFNPSAKRGETTNKPSFINIEAGNDSFMDHACVQIGCGNTLRKMTINDNVSHVWLMNDGKDYAAATIEELQGEMPVNFKAAVDGTYTINVEADDVVMNYLHLIDNLTGADVDLLANPSYTFNARNDDYASRFRLVFSVNGVNENTTNDNFAFISNGQIILTEQGDVQVYDVMGRMISSHNNVNRIATEGMAAGVYVIRLTNGSETMTQKIVIR